MNGAGENIFSHGYQIPRGYTTIENTIGARNPIGITKVALMREIKGVDFGTSTFEVRRIQKEKAARCIDSNRATPNRP